MIETPTLAFLGPPRVTRADGDDVPLRVAKELALLAYLAVEGPRPHSRDSLLGLLWPDVPEQAARNSLRVALAHLRRALDPVAASALGADRRAVWFARPDAWVDVAAFTALLAAVRVHDHAALATCAPCLARLESAVALYRGEFLAEVSLPDGDALQDWARVRREALHRETLAALATLAAGAEAGNDDAMLCRVARRELSLEPWHEPAHRRLMRGLARSGERGAALAQYDTCRRLLVDALGVEPDGETTALYADIRAGPRASARQTAAPAALPRGTPVPLTPLLGREVELARLEALLADPTRRLIALVGPGGVGKTRLAMEGARRAADAFADGAAFVDLTPLADPALVAPALAAALGVREMAGDPLSDTLMDALHERHLLLVLDNCERVVGAAPFVAALLAACPRLTVLVTSRMPLHLRGEQEFVVEPLAIPDPACGLPPAALAAFPAVMLFAARARAVTPAFTVTADNAVAVAAICARLDGLPLAIELAATRVKMLSPQAILLRLENRLALLTGGPRDAPAHQRTLRGTIAWSHELLDAAEQRVFRRLGAFSGDSTLEAIAAVAADAAAPDPLDAVAALVDQSLLRRSEGPDGEPRFGMLETIREYAAERLAEHGEGNAVRRRHADCYLRLAEEAEAQLRGGEQRVWLARLEAEDANLQAALAWCLAAGEGARGLRLAGSLGAFWRRRGHLSPGYDWLTRLLAACPAAAETTPARAKALCYAGQFAYHRIDTATALRALEESVGLYRQRGDTGRRGLAEALTWLGAARLSADWDLPRARAALDEAVAIAHMVDDPWTLAGALTRLGMALLAHGDDATAGPPLEEGLTLWRASGDRWGEGWALFYLGNTAELAGEVATARGRYEASVDAWRSVGDAAGIAGVLGYLGNLAHTAGDEARARACHEEGLATHRSTGNRVGVAYTLSRLGGVAAAQGDRSEAARRYRESLAIFRDLDYGRGLAEWLAGLADTARAAGEAPLAARLLGGAAAQLARLGTNLFPADRADFNRIVAATRAALDAEAFAAAWDAGRAGPLEGTIAAGLATLE